MKIPTRRQVKVEFMHPIDLKVISFYKYFSFNKGCLSGGIVAGVMFPRYLGTHWKIPLLKYLIIFHVFPSRVQEPFFENKSGCSICIYCETIEPRVNQVAGVMGVNRGDRGDD